MKKIEIRRLKIYPYGQDIKKIDIPKWTRYILFKNVKYPLKAQFDLSEDIYAITENTILDTNFEYNFFYLAGRKFYISQGELDYILSYVCDIYFLTDIINLNEEYITFNLYKERLIDTNTTHSENLIDFSEIQDIKVDKIRIYTFNSNVGNNYFKIGIKNGAFDKSIFYINEDANEKDYEINKNLNKIIHWGTENILQNLYLEVKNSDLINTLTIKFLLFLKVK